MGSPSGRGRSAHGRKWHATVGARRPTVRTSTALIRRLRPRRAPGGNHGGNLETQPPIASAEAKGLVFTGQKADFAGGDPVTRRFSQRRPGAERPQYEL